MGGGNTKQLPDVDTFRKIAQEYDKLKMAGLSIEEMHIIMNKRLSVSSGNELPFSNSDNSSVLKSDEAQSENKSSGSDNQNAKSESLRGAESTDFQNDGTSKSSKSVRVNENVTEISSPPETNTGMVLLIDDSPVAAKVASKVLQALKFNVVSANSAKMGFDILMAKQSEIDLIFLDVVMPKVDGVECLSWIKDSPDVAHIPVYMLSGLEDQLLTDVCIERGAEGMFLKPLNATMVKEIMETHQLYPSDAQEGEAGSDNLSRAENLKSKRAKEMSKSISSKITVNTGGQAPAFKLCDSGFHMFSYPHEDKNVMIFLIFIPTIYCENLFSPDGFLSSLFQVYEQLTANPHHRVVCVTSDLPCALAAAKIRFDLPFTLLSDPSLFVSRRFVGSIDIGKYMAESDEVPASKLYALHKQNSFVGPNLGVLLLNKNRDVLHKWLSSNIEDHEPLNLQCFPSDILEWVDNAEKRKRDQDNEIVVEKEVKTEVKPRLSNANPKQQKSESRNDSGPKKSQILIVDDSSVSSRVASKKLERMNYAVTCAYNGQQAFDMLKREPMRFMVILVDVVMPVCDGMELLRMIKADVQLAKLPVVMLSGLEGEDLRKTCMDFGASALMKKPFDEDQFQDVLKKLK